MVLMRHDARFPQYARCFKVLRAEGVRSLSVGIMEMKWRMSKEGKFKKDFIPGPSNTFHA